MEAIGNLFPRTIKPMPVASKPSVQATSSTSRLAVGSTAIISPANDALGLAASSRESSIVSSSPLPTLTAETAPLAAPFMAPVTIKTNGSAKEKAQVSGSTSSKSAANPRESQAKSALTTSPRSRADPAKKISLIPGNGRPRNQVEEVRLEQRGLEESETTGGTNKIRQAIRRLVSEKDFGLPRPSNVGLSGSEVEGRTADSDGDKSSGKGSETKSLSQCLESLRIKSGSRIEDIPTFTPMGLEPRLKERMVSSSIRGDQFLRRLRCQLDRHVRN